MENQAESTPVHVAERYAARCGTTRLPIPARRKDGSAIRPAGVLRKSRGPTRGRGERAGR